MANIVPASERDLSSSIAKKVIVNGALGNLVSCWFYLFNAKIVILSRGPHLLLVAPSSMEYNSVIPGTPVYKGSSLFPLLLTGDADQECYGTGAARKGQVL